MNKEYGKLLNKISTGDIKEIKSSTKEEKVENQVKDYFLLNHNKDEEYKSFISDITELAIICDNKELRCKALKRIVKEYKKNISEEEREKNVTDILISTYIIDEKLKQVA